MTTPPDFFNAVKQHSQLFNGILDATLSHAAGWHFANLGRLLERADKTSRILDVKYFTLLPTLQDVGTTLDDLQLGQQTPFGQRIAQKNSCARPSSAK